MTFDDFIEGFGNEELRELARAIERNEVSANHEADLRQLLERVAMQDRQRVFEEKPGIVDLLVALGLDFEFPEGEIPTREIDEVEEEAAENGVEIEEAESPAPSRGIAERGPSMQPDRPGLGVEPGERLMRDTSRISGNSIQRDIGFETVFMELMRDVGRCDQFDCFNPENYFRLTEQEQRRYFDFTPADALAWLVRRGEVTPQQLRARNFPSDVIP